MKKNNIYKLLVPIIYIIACVGLFSNYYTAIQTIINPSFENQIDLSKYPSVYSNGENLKEIYTKPIFGIYIYFLPHNSPNKYNINLVNGIYIEKPTAKVNGNTVQNIFVFDEFPDIEKLDNISDYKTLINTIIEQQPIIGFHRCYVKFYENYYNQAFTFEKDKNQYIFYDGALGNWQAKSSSTKKFTVIDSSEYTGGMWEYKEKSQVLTPKTNKKSLQNDTVTLGNSPQLHAQYKAEIEKAINNGVIKAKKEMNKTYEEANKLYDDIIITDNYTHENYNQMDLYSREIETPVFYLYFDLINITEKYTKQHKDLATDYYGVLADYVEPIMKKYKVSNLNKLTELEAEMAQKSKEIDTRAKGIYNAIYGTN